MGVKHADYLFAKHVVGCRQCHMHLTTYAELLSSNFTGLHGRAVLVGKVVNVTPATPEDREMRTGRYTIQDVTCSRCGTYLGWYYLRAFEHDEKYKQSKWILERERITEVQQ